MAQLLLEILTQEIPSRMQLAAGDQLARRLGAALSAARLPFGDVCSFVTPRRLAARVSGLASHSRAHTELRRGPRIGADARAIAGFVRSAGLADISEAGEEHDKKGAFFVARKTISGKPAADLVAAFMPQLLGDFEWPKSMRWGNGDVRWVRPVDGIICVMKADDGAAHGIEFEFGDVRAGTATQGHRFMAPGRIEIRDPDSYEDRLAEHFVTADHGARKAAIIKGARESARAHNLELVEDDDLAGEVAGLVEWPVILSGTFDPGFLALPDAVIALTIRANQKCFVLREKSGTRLSNRFVLAANIAASDGGAAIVRGNERVIAARLADARFFHETDLQRPLEENTGRLADIVFHKALGSQAARCARISVLARQFAQMTGADVEAVARAAYLAKADLVSLMVGEFPALQGVMGAIYARHQGESAAVAHALEAHYRPRGAGDDVPDDGISMALSLADRIDLVTGFLAMGASPDGSRDPFALRRAALGVVRIILANRLRLSIVDLVDAACAEYHRQRASGENEALGTDFAQAPEAMRAPVVAFVDRRFRQYCRERGVTGDIVDAVMAVGGPFDLYSAFTKIEALGAFLSGQAGQDVLAGTKRAVNILRAAEKGGAHIFSADPDPDLFCLGAERQLHDAVRGCAAQLEGLLAQDNARGAIALLGTLRAPIDAFFDQVHVNAADDALRRNRLRLLASVRQATRQVADFSLINAQGGTPG